MGDRLDRIEGRLQGTYFDSVDKAITVKYGAPSAVKKASYQNRMGASLTGEIHLWTAETAVIRFEQIADDADYSSLTIFNPETVKRLKGAQDKKAADSF